MRGGAVSEDPLVRHDASGLLLKRSHLRAYVALVIAIPAVTCLGTFELAHLVHRDLDQPLPPPPSASPSHP